MFSVSADKQVYFSQGNLQYQFSTDTWRFSENQYDYVGEANSNINSLYDGWIDLFCWGTGNNPTNSSTDYNDFSTFVDWGVNAISNGGNEANLWRTLTKDEWAYLFLTRENAAILFGLGSVNGVNGTILLPDNWTLPEGASFTASTTQGLADKDDSYSDNTDNDHFTDNSYTAEQWAIMELAGAVFMPVGGYRNGTNVFGVGVIGRYWSATSVSTVYSYELSVQSKTLHPQALSSPSYGHSVRLVR